MRDYFTQLRRCFEYGRPFGSDAFEGLGARADTGSARVTLLRLLFISTSNAQEADQRGERQALHDESDENDDEGDKNDSVAAGERCSMQRYIGQCQGDHERSTSANAGPATE